MQNGCIENGPEATRDAPGDTRGPWLYEGVGLEGCGWNYVFLKYIYWWCFLREYVPLMQRKEEREEKERNERKKKRKMGGNKLEVARPMENM